MKKVFIVEVKLKLNQLVDDLVDGLKSEDSILEEDGLEEEARVDSTTPQNPDKHQKGTKESLLGISKV